MNGGELAGILIGATLLVTRWVPRVAIAFAIAAILIDLGLARPGAAFVLGTRSCDRYFARKPNLPVSSELETARRIQMSLLPRQIPKHADLDIAVRFVPMTAVAGDIYDFVQLGPSCLGILVADVSGHGIPAALVASMVKVAFSAQVDHADDPARVLASMNQILCRHLEHAYVTAVYAVVNTDRQTITIANAASAGSRS